MSAIQEKIKEKEEEKSSMPRENWSGFAYLSLIAFFIILLIGILGSNFIYMTSLTKDALNTILPTDAASYLNPQQMQRGGGMYASEYDDNCIGKSKMSIGVSNTSFMPSPGFPYSLCSDTTKESSFLQKSKNWFGRTCLESFINSRAILKAWLGLFKQGSMLGNDTIQLLFIAPLNLILGGGIGLAFLVGFISTLIALFHTSGPLGLILGFIFLYNFAFMSSVAAIQSLLFVLTFLFLPLITDFKKVMAILHCNISTLTTLFGLFTCITALFTFDLKTSSIYIIAFTLITVISFFMNMM